LLNLIKDFIQSHHVLEERVASRQAVYMSRKLPMPERRILVMESVGKTS
jgi:hypothetical protein